MSRITFADLKATINKPDWHEALADGKRYFEKVKVKKAFIVISNTHA